MTFLVVVLVWFALSVVLALACGAMLRTGHHARHTETGGPLDAPLPAEQPSKEQPSDEQPSDERHTPPMAA